MSISRLKASHCRRMLLALLAACPGNHLHPPDLASQALTDRHKGQEVMTTHGRGSGGSAQRISSGPARLRILLALPAVAAAAAALAACSSAGASSSPAACSSQHQQSGRGGRGHGEDRARSAAPRC